MLQTDRGPTQLMVTQEWFASIITVPIDMESRIAPITPNGNPITEEAKEYVAASPTLEPHQRIQIYNQQYWWRLLNSMQEAFPLLTRLFGYSDFNQTIAIPYIKLYGPNHWSLTQIFNHVDEWVKNEYHKEDKELVFNATTIDLRYNQAFFMHEGPTLTIEEISHDSILETQLTLQPFVFLFELPSNLFAFRDEILKEKPEYWLDHDFPKLDKTRTFYFVLYRNRKKHVAWKEISFEEWTLLQLFSASSSIDDVCAFIETQEASFQNICAEKLTIWFQEWTTDGFLLKNSPYAKEGSA